MMRKNDGFTLLEVLVALAIAIPALLVLYRQGATALSATGASLAYQEAIARAQSRLDSLTDATLGPGDREGDDGGAFRWHTRILPIATTGPAKDTPAKSPYAAGQTLYDVSVEITWPGRRVALQTRRIGPATGETP